MITLAVGRICLDDFFVVRSAKNRIASTKLTADYIGRQFGGSVFSVAKLLTEAGCPCTFIGAMSKADLSALDEPLSLKIIQTPTTPHSFVYLNQHHTLDRIYSVNESEAETVAPTSAILDFVEGQTEPYRLVYDLRQPELVKGILDRFYTKGKLTFLDPGSVMYDETDGAKRDTRLQIIMKSDAVCASYPFYEMFGQKERLSDYFGHAPFAHAKLLICTLDDGRNVFATKDFTFTVSRAAPLTIGNTMGAGDAFRGAFLALWHEDRDSITPDAVLAGARAAIASATLKIESTDPRPVMPKIGDILEKANAMTYAVDESDRLI